MYLKRDDILNVDDLKTIDVEVPEWGGTVCVKMMSGKERDDFEASVVSFKNGKQNVTTANIRAKLVQKTVIDPETKELIFTVADIDSLGKKSSAALDRVFSAAQNLSKISDDDIEELAKN